MNTTLHIFRKDAVRLWKEIVLCQVLLAWLTNMDCWRAYAVPGSTEGWLNLLLPLAWCYLVAACSLLDAVPGERQFWLALPVRRSSVFAAKAMFAGAFLHLPYLISCAVVLNARGFHPWAEMPHLLEKQVFVFLVVTLPALALASIANNAMQFLLMAIALAGAVAVLGGEGSLPFLNSPQGMPDPARSGLVLAIGFVLALVILLVQYRERLTRRSRGIGIAGVATASALYLWLPLHTTVSLQAAFSPIEEGRVTVQAGEPEPDAGRTNFAAWNGAHIRIPLRISGLAPGAQPGLLQLDFQVRGPNGAVYTAPAWSTTRQRGSSLAALIDGQRTGAYFLNVSMERGLYASLAHAPIALGGHFRVVRRSSLVVRSLTESRNGEIPELGRCSTSLTSPDLYLEQSLHVECESTDEPPGASAQFTDTSTGGHWGATLRTSGSIVFYPTLIWLSPVNRTEAYFQLRTEDDHRYADGFRAPVSALQHYTLTAQWQRLQGLAVVGYEISGVDLSRYLVAK